MSKSERIAWIRTGLLGLTGVVCLLYALLVLVTGNPKPLPWWLPGGLGVLAGLVITASFARAGPNAIRAATDELHRQVNNTAQKQAYWASLAAFVVIVLSVVNDVIDPHVGFAALGTLMGASYLLLFVFHEWRMGR